MRQVFDDRERPSDPMTTTSHDKLRVALVHDWLVTLRGGEKVLDELAGLFPRADLYTLIHVPRSSTERIDSLRIFPSPLFRLPGVSRYYRSLAPILAPTAIERFRLEGYDLVISSSHSYAKGIRAASGTPHLCYCHTPIRYVWGHEDAYLGRSLKRRLAQPLVRRLREWDRRTSSADRVSLILANSHNIADRIHRAWQRDSTVVYPGVDTARFTATDQEREAFFLLVGGFVPYKAERLAIDAFRRSSAPLVVVGDGPMRARLQSTAPANVRFLGRVSEAALGDLYARCRALIYPQEEDFGMVAVEAQAAGAPVIAFGRGGATETVVPPGDREGRAPTGTFFLEPTSESLVAAIDSFESTRSTFAPAAIRANAQRFTIERFRQGILEAVEQLV
jgi:glycosyltransferase involved in cell wall biosynthesis